MSAREQQEAASRIGKVDLAIEVDDLTFSYPSSYNEAMRRVLTSLNMKLAPGTRCLLIGANGAGKSTLLKILAGKHLTKPEGAVKVMGTDAFRDLKLNLCRAFLDTQWGTRTVAFAGYGCPLAADIRVGDMMQALQATWPERRDDLVSLLGIDLDWRMHMVSDGQRRRVQLLLALIRPFDILLLDEVTTCLDVIVRQDLLWWLQAETENRGATIVYATHIFDGLDDWPTHVHFLTRDGSTGWQGKLEDNEFYTNLRKEGYPSPMLKLATTWLRAELDKNKHKNESEEGPGAIESKTYKATDRGGGFNPGRMLSYKA
mmetsp:Transcript_35268/g.112763  ORF Transcript_35268/g.112763 Transcript_35268/m.112763 type:complete len:316 (+) Transcript_35268:160-1107(+)